MDRLTTIIPAKRRKYGKGRPSPLATGPLAVASVSGVSFNGTSGTLTAVFNVSPPFALADVSAAMPGKWIARYANVRYIAVALAAAGTDGVQLTFTDLNPEAGPNELVYSNAPSDIADTQGRQLAAFGGMPI
jgi:hypothetical protein